MPAAPHTPRDGSESRAARHPAAPDRRYRARRYCRSRSASEGTQPYSVDRGQPEPAYRDFPDLPAARGYRSEYPPQYRKVQITVAEILQVAQESLIRLFDVKFTREFADCTARANVVVDGLPLLDDVPAGYLLFLETKLEELIKLIGKLPVLNPADDWHDNRTDPALPDGVYATSPQETIRAEPVRQVQVLVPNQVIDGKPFEGKFVPYETQDVVGYWSQIKMSGELPASVAQAVRARAVKLLEAVKYARESANTMDVTDRQAGAVVLGYVFGPVLTD